MHKVSRSAHVCNASTLAVLMISDVLIFATKELTMNYVVLS